MRLFSWLHQFRPFAANRWGWVLLQIGLFLLPSSTFLGGLCLLPALVMGSCNRHYSYWRDCWNYPFILAAILMLISCLKAFSGWLAWAGLANWLPFFWSFWAFQPYLKTVQSRNRIALCLLAGTVPVVLTGLGQMFLGWQGPWKLFNGLVIWFVAPGGQPSGRLSGLFNYANITGAWLALVWPFCLAALIQPFLSRLHRSVVFILTVGIIVALVLTDSRNAWSGLMLAIPFVLGPSSWMWLFPCLILMVIPVAFAVLPGVDLSLQKWARRLVPENLWGRLSDMKYLNRPFSTTRLGQWQVAINYVIQRPLLGWGAAAFSVLYPLNTGIWHGHAHNLPLELAVSHGFPVAVLIVGSVMSLLIVVLRLGVLVVSDQTNNVLGKVVFDRAWWTATFILVFLHGSDMPLFDARLNIVGWLLLAGLRCMVSSLRLIKQGNSDFSVDVQ